MSRTVAIVGRPNVGKSALFNRLAQKKIAIVHDQPGVTRDRIPAECKLGKDPFTIFDTGGIGQDVDASFSVQVRAEVDIAVATSEVLLFVVDGQEGLTPLDADLAKQMRRVHKPIILVVNKIDHTKHGSLTSEFTKLGFERVVSTSAEHGLGIKVLVDNIEDLLPPPTLEESAEPVRALRIAIVGRPNVGKSSLTNAILGDERTLVSPISGTTRDAVDITYQRGERHYILIDTAGIRARSKVDNSVEVFSVMRSESSIKRADLCCLIIDATAGVTSQDKKIAGTIQESHRPCIIVVNKWDLIKERTESKEKLQEVIDEIQSELFFLTYAPILLVSAKTGASLTRVFKAIEKIQKGAHERLGTGQLNRVIADAFSQQPAAMRNGKRFKVLYATVPEPRRDEPIPLPEIVLFCNNPKYLDEHFRRYLDSCIRQQVPYVGLPLMFRFRGREERGQK
jgi:GTP-binding protein